MKLNRPFQPNSALALAHKFLNKHANSLIIADEATSALDVSLRSQMLDLMMQLQDEMGLSFIFISHDMSVIRYMCDRVGVMYRGQIVETGTTEDVTGDPQHGYTQALLSAIPHPDPRERRLEGRVRYQEIQS